MKKEEITRRAKYSLILLLLTVFILSSCNLSEPQINSRLAKDKLGEVGADVGIVWKEAEVTNLAMALRGGNWDSEEIADVCVIKRDDDEYYMWYSGRGPYGVVSSEKSPSLWRIGFASSKDGITWQKDYVNNPVIIPGENECEDRKGARLISVIYDEAERVYKMWYRGHDGTNLSIFYATSQYPNRGWLKSPNDTLDNGRNPDPVLRLKKITGTTPGAPVKVKETVTFKDVVEVENLVTSSKSKITIDTTTDIMDKPSSGLDLTAMGYDFQYEGSGAVIKEVNYITSTIKRDVYKMWYVVKERNKYIIKFAYSFSGTNWFTDLNTTSIFKEVVHPFCEEGAVMPTVIADLYEDKMIYKMWFTGVKGTDRTIGLAYCKGDGSKFSYKLTSPIVDKNNTPADSQGLFGANVIRDENSYRMWYVGKGDDNVYRVCHQWSSDN